MKLKDLQRIILVVFSLFLAPNIYANTVDSLCLVLDQCVAEANVYTSEHQRRIDELILQNKKLMSDDKRCEVYHELYQEYSAFRNDSALHYLDLSIKLAAKLGNDAKVQRYRMQMVYQYSNTGYYNEALRIMNSLDSVKLAEQGLLGEYAFVKRHYYGEMSNYSVLADERQYFDKMMNFYHNIVVKNLPETDDRSLQCLEMNLLSEGKASEALMINDRRIRQVGIDSRQAAIVAFYRYLDLKQRGDSIEALEWIIRSSICDIRHGIMDQAALWEVANTLLASGDTERAHRYIGFAWQCAEVFGTRLRIWQITPVMKRIDSAWQANITKAARLQNVVLVLISILLIIAVVAFFYVSRQHKKMSKARQELSEKNEQLNQMYAQVKEQNQQLQQMSAELTGANHDLTESNRIKEEYIGRFLRLCSLYLDKMDALRKRVSKFAKTKSYDELIKLSRSSDFKEKELEELYSSFDSAFLHLFPNFIEDFNALLRPEERIVVLEKDRLNTTIRIFALIRLGIDDSSKIAEFLHYSVNTIYNYRARIKSTALEGKETFEERVKKL